LAIGGPFSISSAAIGEDGTVWKGNFWVDVGPLGSVNHVRKGNFRRRREAVTRMVMKLTHHLPASGLLWSKTADTGLEAYLLEEWT
jgi:hypothetical protein